MWDSQPENKEAIFINVSNILKNSNKHFEFTVSTCSTNWAVVSMESSFLLTGCLACIAFMMKNGIVF